MAQVCKKRHTRHSDGDGLLTRSKFKAEKNMTKIDDYGIGHCWLATMKIIGIRTKNNAKTSVLDGTGAA